MVDIPLLALCVVPQNIIRLCVETPTAGGRVFETGDEELLKFVQKISSAFQISRFITLQPRLQPTSCCQSVPIVIVFTQYDRLVRTKRAELKEDHQYMDDHTLDSRSVEEALKAFEKCLQSLRQTMGRLKIQMPPYARVSGTFVPLHSVSDINRLSVRPGFQEDISEVVEVTRKTVKERLQGDAWIMWAIVQRANLPVKIEACIT